ncbi:acyl carrier protein [Psychroserpens luteus]|uniref:Acyl carrier protein n=1 Tax=Psychroserpens luteus TaxID=1434066 RepID=A0ABW5ZS64_9FLAO|nr:acyl carrier protein [Psychroserpens luteus]
MDKPELIDRLTTIFRATFDADSLVLTDELTANDVDNWDSLTHMILISEIEKGLDIKFKLKELNKMKNVGALIEIITSKIN